MLAVSRRDFVFGLLPGIASAQPEPVFKADVKVVNILATVRDKRGRIVQDLTKDEFNLLEEGQPQEIRYFAKQTGLPLTVGLLVDTSMSQEHVLPEERQAAQQFFNAIIRPRMDDELIVTFDTRIRIPREIPEIRIPQDRREGTLLYDAVYSICDQKLSSKDGRRIMVILSDGVDYGSKANVDDATGAALRNDVVVNTILFSDATYYGHMNPSGPYTPRIGAAAMKGMAQATGGIYLEVAKDRTVRQMFDRIVEGLHNQYSLGFVSNRPATKSEIRKLDLKTKQDGLLVEARKWYFAQP